MRLLFLSCFIFLILPDFLCSHVLNVPVHIYTCFSVSWTPEGEVELIVCDPNFFQK